MCFPADVKGLMHLLVKLQRKVSGFGPSAPGGKTSTRNRNGEWCKADIMTATVSCTVAVNAQMHSIVRLDGGTMEASPQDERTAEPPLISLVLARSSACKHQ